MSLKITGKHIDVGESFQSYASDRLDDAVEKYIGKYLAAHIRIEKERGRFLTNCSVRLRTGLMLESTGDGTSAYASADAAFEHLEKRMRRYKRRLKSHHHGFDGDIPAAADFGASDAVVMPEEESDADGASDASADAGQDARADNPVVIAESERLVRRLSVSEAVMQLDLTEDAFLVFRNAANAEINVVYRRPDGNIGWIDPASPAGARIGQPAFGQGVGQALNGAARQS